MKQELLDNTNPLRLYLCCKGISAATFARAIGYSPQIIRAYVSGRQRIGSRGAKLIELLTNRDVTQEEILRFNPPLPEKRVDPNKEFLL